MRVLAAAIAVSLGLAGAAGCGGDDGAPGGAATGAAAAPTRAAFIAEADAVCRRTNVRIAATNARIAQINRTATSEREALAEAAPLLAETSAAQRESVGEIRALEPPDGDEAAVARIVAGIEQQVATVGQVADAARSGDAARVRALGAELQTTRTRVRGLFQGYGFEVCGRG
jgi:hypothetical protein